ncbi:MAG: sigma-70 family RNA polymerase sigma factor [Candidatus Omnitrophica bacterium]|nr:sigma-70 family RNA polymerase sigma factor [Candidatus Omnitrophota bacterium]
MDDLEFVQRCVKGDKLAWDEFVEKYSRLIYNYIHSVIKFKGAQQISQDNIDDLYQEIFTLLIQDNFKKLKSFKAKNGASLVTWLRQVVVNFTIDYLRERKPLISLDEEDDDALNLKDMLASNSPSAGDSLESQERLNQLKDCIQTLDTDEQYFVDLHIHQGLPLEKLTTLLGLARGLIDVRKARIIERLRDCFKSKGFLLDFG